MKIAIIGTHSTGKTTLLKRLAERLEQLGHTTVILPEYARLCPFPINEDTTLTAQAWIQEAQMREEKAIDHKDKILLCDRATLDNFAYFSRIAELVGEQELLSPWEKKAVGHMYSYDAVFKTTKLAFTAADGVRSTDQEFRDEIDGRIDALLKKHKIHYYTLPASEDYDAHVALIISKLNLPGKNK